MNEENILSFDCNLKLRLSYTNILKYKKYFTSIISTKSFPYLSCGWFKKIPTLNSKKSCYFFFKKNLIRNFSNFNIIILMNFIKNSSQSRNCSLNKQTKNIDVYGRKNTNILYVCSFIRSFVYWFINIWMYSEQQW